MSFAYNPLIPSAPNNPADDQPFMQQNFASINSWVNVDHLGFNGTNGGYHNVIHFNNQLTNPSASLNFAQLFTKNITNTINTDQVLFTSTGQGTISQLGSNITPTSSQNGCTYLPGGILLNWGFLATISNPIVFTQRFSSNAFCVLVSAQGDAAGTGADISLAVKAITATQFNVSAHVSNPASLTGIHWLAIGPAN